jgi:hypothetical protein
MLVVLAPSIHRNLNSNSPRIRQHNTHKRRQNNPQSQTRLLYHHFPYPVVNNISEREACLDRVVNDKETRQRPPECEVVGSTLDVGYGEGSECDVEEDEGEEGGDVLGVLACCLAVLCCLWYLLGVIVLMPVSMPA